MKEELEKKLVEKYKTIFKDYKGDPRVTAMAWGFECGDGWYNLIENLCSDLEKISNNIVAVQVKEKFGGLRFYYHLENIKISRIQKLNYNLRTFLCSKGFYKLYWKFNDYRKKIWSTLDEKISDRVDQAESESFKTCESCGQPGKPRSGGWIKTLCDKCENEQVKNRKDEQQ